MEATKKLILKHAVSLFAQGGYAQFNMRTLARKVRIAPSVLYYYFPNKEALLKDMFDTINTELGVARNRLPLPSSMEDMLKQRIEFQLDHAEEIVAVLKFYLAYRKKFKKLPTGFVPDKAYLHIEEVLEHGISRGEIISSNTKKDAKVLTHAINGFLLEYYPDIPSQQEKQELIDTIHRVLWKAITK